jgi:uncharacterized membrane protein
MIPFVAVVSLRDQESRTFRLWIPLLLIWILLVPIAFLLSPVIFVVCLVCRVNPFHAFSLLWQVLCALGKTEFEVEHRSAGMSFHVL